MTRRFASLAALIVSGWLCAAAGCGEPIPLFCVDDSDCNGYACTRTGECVPEGSLISVRLSWTLYGEQATEELCTGFGIDALRLTFEDASGFERQSYEPVPCEVGQVFYNRMPGRFVLVELAALSSGFVLDARFALLPNVDTVASVDLTP